VAPDEQQPQQWLTRTGIARGKRNHDATYGGIQQLAQASGGENSGATSFAERTWFKAGAERILAPRITTFS